MKGELNRTVMICVDCYDDRVPRGHFQLASKPQIYSFYGLSQLLIQMDACLDQEKFPQAFTELRKFQRPQEGLPEPQEYEALLTRILPLLEEEGRVEDGISVCRRALQMDPYSERNHLSLMRFLLLQGDAAEVVRLYEELGKRMMEMFNGLAERGKPGSVP